jgi:hypothetical protein
MERRVNFYQGQDNSPDDYNNLQGFVSDSLDHIVGDGVTALRRYAGFETAADGALTIATAIGRLYSQGKVYVTDGVFNYDFTASLPVGTRKICTIVTWPEEVDTGAVAREFLIDAETGATEPQVVSMEHTRIARIGVVQGAEAPDPAKPVLDSNVTAIAYVTLSTGGIESVAMVEENKLDSVQSVADRVDDLERFEADIGPQVVSLGADIAALTEGQKELVGVEQYGRVLDRLAVIESKTGVPDAAVDSFADFLLDESGTDSAFAGYDAKVEEGIRFPAAASATSALTLRNPLDPAAKLTGGVLMPAYDRAQRFSTGKPTGEVKVSGYSYATHAMTQKTMARLRVRHGPARLLSSVSSFYKTSLFDIANDVFAKAGEIFVTDAKLRQVGRREHIFRRANFHWADVVEVPYWEQSTVESEVQGTQVVETFLQSNDMVLDAVGLTFTRLAADGAVTIAICETDHGLANLDKVVSKTTVDRADLSTEGETVIPVQPVFLTGGVRYALVIITAADHYLGTVDGSVYPQGTFFYVLDGAYQQGDGTKDIAFSLYAAKFRQARAILELGEVTLAGGIADIDILSQAVVPGSCDLTFFVQIGATWYPLAEVATSALAQGGVMQNLLPLRVVMTGTPDVMPMLTLTGSQVVVSRPKLALNYVSAIRNLPGAGSTQIRATFRLEGFDAAHHTLTPKLLTGAGYATETAASSTTDVVQADGSIERTAVYNLGAAVTSYRHKLAATSDSELIPFHVAARRDYAL